jgi:ABC-type Fe3+-hydroxamate transport system substrate-binding protein
MKNRPIKHFSAINLPPMEFKDQIGNFIHLLETPKRIVSLVPSQTELLFDLGLENEVVGITKFCVHPSNWLREKAVIGGTKNLSISKIQALKPDLIIANKEENDKEQIQNLSKEFNVWTSDIRNLKEALEMIEHLGKITNTENKANEIKKQIEVKFSKLKGETKGKRCVYLIWNNPMMTINGDTYIHDLIVRSGLQNCFEHLKNSRYPIIRADDLKTSNPDILLLSSEPFPFSEKHKKYFQDILPNAQIVIVDGEMFSWYGSRLLKFDPSAILRTIM